MAVDANKPPETAQIAAITPELERFRDESLARSEAVRKKFQHDRGIAFGPHPRQVLDVYYPSRTAGLSPVFVFLHGGGFRGGSPAGVSYMAAALLEQGVTFVASSYRLVPEVKFPDMAEDAALALRWVYQNIRGHGGNEDRVVLSGHSAGASLAALAGFRPGWTHQMGVPEDMVKGLVLISGGYVNRRAGDDVNTASPYFVSNLTESIERTPERTIVVTAQNDLPFCQPDAEALVAALRARGASHEFISAVPDTDHYFVGHKLAEADGAIFGAVRTMLNLK
ncbi:MAG TPA: alpha/beta hydrolase [Chloroflexota bacterium]|nr:alpha/beta hydrolase [Chloroflexota bacterium]